MKWTPLKSRLLIAMLAIVAGICPATLAGPPDCNLNGEDDTIDLLNGTSTDGDNNGIPDECQVRIDQLNYEDGDGVPLPDGEFSIVGQATISYLPPPPGQFLWGQIAVDGQWVVRNLPLVNINNDGLEQELTVQVYLGNLPGQPVPSANVQAEIVPIQLDPLDLASAPSGVQVPLPVNQVIIGHGGRPRNPGDGDFEPDLLLPPDPFIVEQTPPLWTLEVRPFIPNMNVKWNHCSPGAAANSLQCLKDRLCLPLFQTQQQIFDKMRDGNHMKTTKVGGTSPSDIYNGNKRFIARKGLSGRLKVNGIGAHYPDGAFDPCTVHEWMLEGKDVQLDYAYKPRGGHSVVVAASMKCGTDVCIIVRSDHDQHKRVWQTPGDAGQRNGGVSQWDVHCFKEVGGVWTLTGERRNNDLGAVSLCPMVPPVVDYVSSLATVDWSPGGWTKHGLLVGDTFAGGVQTGPTQPEALDVLPLPLWPNDWHWDANFQWNGEPRQVVCWFENFQPESQLGLELYCSPFLPFYMIQIDVGLDQYVLSDDFGPFWLAPFSGYPKNLPPEFEPTGSFRNTFDPNGLPGACCISSNVCLDNLSEAQCFAMDGQPFPFQPCIETGCICPWDCAPPGPPRGNGIVNIDDLIQMLNAISTQDLACDAAPDNNDGSFGNGVVNFDDLVALINNFGPCFQFKE